MFIVICDTPQTISFFLYPKKMVFSVLFLLSMQNKDYNEYCHKDRFANSQTYHVLPRILYYTAQELDRLPDDFGVFLLSADDDWRVGWVLGSQLQIVRAAVYAL